MYESRVGGIQSALGDILKDILPADAVVKDFCKAILDGHFYDSTDPLKVKKILSAESPPDWVGGSDIPWDSSRSKQGKELIQLNQAFSTLSCFSKLTELTEETKKKKEESPCMLVTEGDERVRAERPNGLL